FHHSALYRIPIHTLSLHDALPIFATMVMDIRCTRQAEEIRVLSQPDELSFDVPAVRIRRGQEGLHRRVRTAGTSNESSSGWDSTDRKSTRLNSSHDQISYAVFCLK